MALVQQAGASQRQAPAGADAITDPRVELVIGIERRLRQLFTSLGWENVNDYASGTSADTPWGKTEFQDGVQTWLNPRFALAK